MAKVSLEQIKKLRAKTRAGVMDCRQALLECRGDLEKAKAWIAKKGISSAQNRAGRATKEGVMETYTHADGKIVAVVELFCETDFAARNTEFKKLAHELAMQVAAMSPKNVKDLMAQPYIRDEKKTVEEFLKMTITKIGENITLGRIARFQLGE